MASAAPSFDPVVAHPARLRILAALAHNDASDFVSLRTITQLTDGNLVTHARRLNTAGLVGVHKSARDNGRQVTTYHLTASGRIALEGHARQLLSLLTPPAETPIPSVVADQDDDWID